MGNQKVIRKKPINPALRLKSNPLKDPNAGEISYKNIELLRKFIQDRGRIRSREITGVNINEQRKIVNAIKNARELAMLPFVTISHNTPKKGGRRHG